jgi:8-oxo-dGTP pyrophosphatase MutT (NUDIX family)
MTEKTKDIIYTTALFFARWYWKILRPKTWGGRIILVSRNEVLLVRHRRSQFWNLPGGGISPKKDPVSEVLRELYEETKIKINTADYQLGTYVANGEGNRDRILVFVKRIDETLTPKPSLEIADAQWVSVSNLHENISPATRLRINEYLQDDKNIQRKWL